MELPVDCYGLAGEFVTPTLGQMQRHLPDVMLSRLGRMVFANGADEAEFWTGDRGPHDAACRGRGDNTMNVVTINRTGTMTMKTRCSDEPGPYLLCLEN